MVGFCEPSLSGISLNGLIMDVESIFTVFGQSGTVDFIRFENFTVNSKKVKMHEYKSQFKFKKKKEVNLQTPIQISVIAFQSLKTAIGELTHSKEHWRVNRTNLRIRQIQTLYTNRYRYKNSESYALIYITKFLRKKRIV